VRSASKVLSFWRKNGSGNEKHSKPKEKKKKENIVEIIANRLKYAERRTSGIEDKIEGILHSDSSRKKLKMGMNIIFKNLGQDRD
jgi:hypothetical protein